jgi:hypothetical protein
MMLNVQEKKRDYNKDANPASAVRRFFPKYKQSRKIKTPKWKVYPNESLFNLYFLVPKVFYLERTELLPAQDRSCVCYDFATI